MFDAGPAKRRSGAWQDQREQRLPGSNASEVIVEVKKRMAEIKPGELPPGVDHALQLRRQPVLGCGVQQVWRTSLEAFVLVALVVFAFLQS